MSDENNGPEGQQQQHGAEEAPVAAAAVPEAPKAQAAAPRFTEKHTAENTTMKNPQIPKSCFVRELTEEEITKGYITVFLGNSKEARDHSAKLMAPYIQMLTLRRYAEEDPMRYGPSAEKQRLDWEAFIEANYPDMSLDEAEENAQRMVAFYTEYLDDIKMRSDAIRELLISNVSDRGSLVTSDVSGIKPGDGNRNMKDSELMKRRSLKAEDGRLQFDLELRNSFTKITMARPSKMEMGTLINDIRSEIKGYVRQINNNSVQLARVAAARVIWNFIADRITYASVTDIGDFRQLASVIRWSDIDVLTMGLLRAYTNNGVRMQLICAGPQCGWKGFELVDPELMVHHRDFHTTDEEAAVYANLFNHKATFTIAETLAMIKKANFGLDTNKVFNEDKSIYMELASPSLADAFATFDYYAGRISPKLADLRTSIIDPEEYETQRNMLYTDLGATEYIHLISKFVGVASPGTDGKDLILDRDKARDQNDFNEGLLETIKDSEFLNRTLTRDVINKAPFLSKTFVGLQNFDCPKCKKNQEVFEDPQNIKVRKLGYTPIDPIMAFFTHIQLEMMARTTASYEARVEALSESGV